MMVFYLQETHILDVIHTVHTLQIVVLDYLFLTTVCSCTVIARIPSDSVCQSFFLVLCLNSTKQESRP